MMLVKVKSNDIRACRFLFMLRNKNYVKEYSLNKKSIKFSSHTDWFKDYLKKKNIIYIIHKKKIMVGYIRMEKVNNFYYVSWAILQKYQKMGFAKKGLILATKNRNYKYKAFIKKNNITSIKIAEKANFKRKFAKQNILYFYK